MTSRVNIYNPQGRKLTEFDVDFYREWKLSEYGIGKFSISMLDSKFSEENVDFGNWVYVEHDKLAPWIGTIEPPRKWRAGIMEIECKSGEARLDRVVTKPGNKKWGTFGDIFEYMIEEYGGSLNLIAGDIWRGGLRSHMGKEYLSLYEQVIKAAEKADAEWNVTPAVDLRNNVYFACNFQKRIGIPRGDWLYEDKHFAYGGTLTEQGEIHNSYWVFGAGGAFPSKPVGHAQDEASIADYGLAEWAMMDDELTEENADDIAENYVRENKDPRKTFELSLIDYDNLFKRVRIGDSYNIETYQLGFTGRRQGLRTRIRFLEMSYKDSENTVKVTADEVKE